ncbi:hypothetical protein DXG03_001063 [Asterophora parasitica]|uniref:BTB domain-containing protein n=1 Tax=Asterophora parasitica TaxID=117018 RepID=A0A9P7G4E6_9AGAR|nr:hypothetical protein DXG03_001063 [Asterophora parasitica]
MVEVSEPIRSDEFWFSDGSIVILVENTAFRVHKSILSKHSDVFADLFTVPQPVASTLGNDSADSIEGVPVVHLSDNVADFTEVIRALYEPFHFDKLKPDADLVSLIHFVSGILRVSTKYNIVALREKCIAVLRTKFPSTLADCDMLIQSRYKYAASTIVRAIPLARESNVPEILPWAFYISTNIAHEALLEDTVLSWHDKALCLAGKHHLWEMQKTVTHRFHFDNVGGKPPTCQNPNCLPRLPQMMSWRRTEELRVSPHPLEQFTDWDSLKVCPRCVEYAQMLHEKGREKVWKGLPAMFQLGSWEDIFREQNR